VKPGGFSAPTQDVSGGGGIGEERYDDRLGARGLGGDGVPDARDADDGRIGQPRRRSLRPASDVSVSKLPETTSVGMLLITG
jgi:hypothetical protein